jgi:hypothetical protein
VNLLTEQYKSVKEQYSPLRNTLIEQYKSIKEQYNPLRNSTTVTPVTKYLRIPNITG